MILICITTCLLFNPDSQAVCVSWGRAWSSISSKSGKHNQCTEKKPQPLELLVAFERAEFCSVPEIAHSEAHWAAFPALRCLWKGRNATEPSSKGALKASVLEQSSSHGREGWNSTFYGNENTWGSHLIITPTSSISGSIILPPLREYFGNLSPQKWGWEGNDVKYPLRWSPKLLLVLLRLIPAVKTSRGKK